MANLLELDYEKTEDKIIIKLKGEVDIYSAPHFKERMYDIVTQKTNVDVVIDCLELSYIDSTGLGILVGVLKKVKANNKNVYIINLKDNMKKLFLITGLNKVFVLEE